MRPWWVVEGAEIDRHVFERPFGRDCVRFAMLREQRLLYRLALGQPNQEDFLDILSGGGAAARALLRPLVLDLSAMGLRRRSAGAIDPNELDRSLEARADSGEGGNVDGEEAVVRRAGSG